MPTLKVGGKEIKGVMKAKVEVIHNGREAERVPIMQWDIVLGLQNEDTLQKWALAQQGADRWKACELVIKHREGDAAHTWTLKKAYVHLLEEVEFPQEGTAGGATDTGYFTHAVIRGVLQQAEDYTGDNVMTVNPGGPEALPA